MTTNEDELQKVIFTPINPIFPTFLHRTAQLTTCQLYVNLSNAIATYGPSSQPARQIESIIADFLASSSSTSTTPATTSASSSAMASAENSPKATTVEAMLPTFQNLVIRPKRL
ncbi:hypothetical protein BT63DRAFT_457054 [Microthyrium microscopicum]|uniref:Uncharacterized protein n=1 Tax=Microthyrium microscopicum TaxID=703497 RepID=A0A6A6U6G3_9PEZI|nr:hypothetical protein BT63DRAFT_457054 [Microthyrium microscopicum]